MYPKSLFCWTVLASLTAARWVPKRNGGAPLIRVTDEHRVPDMYIVKMRDGFTALDTDDTIAAHTTDARHIYSATSFKGFAKSLNDTSVQSLRANPNVEYVQEDSQFYMSDYATQENAPYGIARISHRNRGDNSYIRDDSDGDGTCVNDGTADGNNIIAAIDWVAQDAQSRDCPKGTVANLSLGGGKSQASNDAVAGLVNAGTFVAVASGNDNVDAANTSPASELSACTVSASDENDAKAGFSNYGSVVDIWAPGTNIESTSYEGGSTTASGTSASSPIIAGLGAYLLSLEGDRDPIALCDRIKELSTQGILTNVPSDTINALGFNGNPSG